MNAMVGKGAGEEPVAGVIQAHPHRFLCFRDADGKLVEIRDLDTKEILLRRRDDSISPPLSLCSFSITRGEWMGC